MEFAPELPFYAYSSARSLGYTAEFFLLESIASLLPGLRKGLRDRNSQPDVKTLLAIRRDMQALLRQDSRNIAQGVYPARVLAPESLLTHGLRFPKLVADGLAIASRKLRGRTTEFDAEASELLEELPRYYRRNFHFQTGGYLSRRSAEVYEHQVELLFKGSADAMRRLIIPPLRARFKDRPHGEGLRFLELGAGTGRATRFVSLAFPKARIVAADLSDPYLATARKNLARFPRVDFLHADGASLPFKDGEFDAVYSVFLFHELPMAVRKEVIAESVRVARDGAFIGLVDSLQTGDKPLFDPLLSRFPEDFHEPFYRDYIAHPMEKLLHAEEALAGIERGLGFSSKACWASINRPAGSTAGSRAGVHRPRSAS